MRTYKDRDKTPSAQVPRSESVTPVLPAGVSHLGPAAAHFSLADMAIDRPRTNRTGLPLSLKERVEKLSGSSLDDVRVHYRSPKPAQVNALAYAQGTHIYVGPGQEQHLAHEAWHVVQQKQGRVRSAQPTRRGPINDDPSLEREAGVMAEKALVNRVPSAIQPHLAPVTQPSLLPIQRVRIPNSKTGEFYEPDTEDMTAGERLGLALELYQLHNTTGLQLLREAHPDEDFSDGTLVVLAAPARQEDIVLEGERSEEGPSRKRGRGRKGSDTRKKKKKEKEKSPSQKGPRTRPYHNLSEGESESEDPDVGWRALRKEEDPFKEGLKPPLGHDPSKTASAHISAGSKAKVKSAWVSGTRSRKVAGSWATSAKGGKRIAKFRIPGEKRGQSVRLGGEEGVESRMVYDLTDPTQASEVFTSDTGTALNAAKGSQEVVIYGGLEAVDVSDVFRVEKITLKDYQRLKEQLEAQKKGGDQVNYKGGEVYAVFRTRAKATEKTPLARVLIREPRPEKET